MSIIDEALKGVERSQTNSADGLPESSLVAGDQSRRLPMVVGMGLVVVAAIAVGWWQLGFQAIETGLENQAEVGDDLLNTDSQERSAAARSEPVGPALATDDDQVAELTKTAIDSETPIVFARPQGNLVAALTEHSIEVESDSNGVSLLTASMVGQTSAAASMSTVDQQQLAELTARPDKGVITAIDDLSVAELTVGEKPAESGGEISAVEALTAPVVFVSTDSVADLTDSLPAATPSLAEPGNGEIANESVEGLTAITAVGDNLSSAAPMDSNHLTALESVAGLTRADAGSQVESRSAHTADAAASGVSALTESTVAEAQIPTVTSPTEVDPVIADVAKPPVPVTEPVIDTAAAVRRAVAAEIRGDYPAAIEALAGADGNASDVTLIKARLLARLGRFDQSSELFTSVGETALDANASFWLGFARFNLEQWQSAVAPLTRAGELNADDAIAPFYLGLAQQQAGDYLASIAAFHRARTLRPDMPEIAFNTGISWWALGDKGRARGAFRHFMRITDGQRQTYVDQRRRVGQSYLRSAGSN